MQPSASPDDAPVPLSLAGRFAVVRDVFVRPDRAFAAIGGSAPWFVPYLFAVALIGVSVAASAPAAFHVEQVEAAHDATLRGQLPAGAAALGTVFLSFSIMQNSILWIFCAMVLTSAVAGPVRPRRFTVMLALVVAGSLPALLGGALEGLVLLRVPAETYTTFRQVIAATPDSLAAFVPQDSEKALIFLSEFTPFVVWSAIVTGYGYATLGGRPAWVGTAVVLVAYLMLGLVNASAP